MEGWYVHESEALPRTRALQNLPEAARRERSAGPVRTVLLGEVCRYRRARAEPHSCEHATRMPDFASGRQWRGAVGVQASIPERSGDRPESARGPVDELVLVQSLRTLAPRADISF